MASGIVLMSYYATGVDLKTTGSVVLVPAVTGRLFVALGAVARVATLTGALAVGPICRMGNNGNHDNVIPLFTIGTLSVVNTAILPPLTGAPAAIDVGSTGISVEVQTPATATTMTADFHLYGVFL